MPIRAVVYASEASTAIAQEKLGQVSGKLDAIIDDACRFNRDAGVTGALLFDGERFLQYLEGPEDGLLVAYSRVRGASSHSALVELHQGRTGHRRLPFWPMRWFPVEPAELRVLALADWTGFKQRGDAQASDATGMDLLFALLKRYALAA